MGVSTDRSSVLRSVAIGTIQLGPVAHLVWRRRDRLDVDPHPVHVGESLVERLHLRLDGGQLPAVHVLGELATEHQRHATQPLGLRANHVGHGGGLAVTVDVDHRSSPTAAPRGLRSRRGQRREGCA